MQKKTDGFVYAFFLLLLLLAVVVVLTAGGVYYPSYVKLAACFQRLFGKLLSRTLGEMIPNFDLDAFLALQMGMEKPTKS